MGVTKWGYECNSGLFTFFGRLLTAFRVFLRAEIARQMNLQKHLLFFRFPSYRIAFGRVRTRFGDFSVAMSSDYYSAAPSTAVFSYYSRRVQSFRSCPEPSRFFIFHDATELSAGPRTQPFFHVPGCYEDAGCTLSPAVFSGLFETQHNGVEQGPEGARFGVPWTFWLRPWTFWPPPVPRVRFKRTITGWKGAQMPGLGHRGHFGSGLGHFGRRPPLGG